MYTFHSNLVVEPKLTAKCVDIQVGTIDAGWLSTSTTNLDTGELEMQSLLS